MLQDFAVVLAFMLVAAGFVILPLLIQRFVAPRNPTPEKLLPYECGEDAVGTPWVKFNIRFYVFALIFLVFEVELIFVLPWAVVYRNMAYAAQIAVEKESVVVPQGGVSEMARPALESGAGAAMTQPPAPAPPQPVQRNMRPSESWALVWLPFAEGVLFILILVVGLVYVWAKGDLEWVKPDTSRMAHVQAVAPAGKETETHA